MTWSETIDLNDWYKRFSDWLCKQLEKVEQINKLNQRAIDKWLPCPDHRDKVKEVCYVCENESLKKRLEKMLEKMEEVRNAYERINERRKNHDRLREAIHRN